MHAPARTRGGDGARRAATRSRSCCRSRTCARGIDWERAADGLRDALVADLEATFGLTGLGASVRVEHRMTPVDFERELGAVWGNAFAVEPTLHQSAYFRAAQPRPATWPGCTTSGGGTHPGAGIPGVLLGAEVTAGLVARRTRRAERADGARH